MVVNPGGIAGGQSVYTWPVGGSTGITPAHNACEVPEASHRTGEWAPRITLREKSVTVNPRSHSRPHIPTSAPLAILSQDGLTVSPDPCIYLAGIFAPLHIAGTHHVLLDKVGLLGLGSDVVEAVACPTTNDWNLKLL